MDLCLRQFEQDIVRMYREEQEEVKLKNTNKDNQLKYHKIIQNRLLFRSHHRILHLQ